MYSDVTEALYSLVSGNRITDPLTEKELHDQADMVVVKFRAAIRAEMQQEARKLRDAIVAALTSGKEVTDAQQRNFRP